MCCLQLDPEKDPVPTLPPHTPVHTLPPTQDSTDPYEVFKLFGRIKTGGLCFAPDKHHPYQKITHAITHIALGGKEEKKEEREESNLYLPVHISALTVQVSVEIIMHMQSADRYDAWLQKWHRLCTEPSGPEWALGDCFLFSLLLQVLLVWNGQ